jgi:hypothetical protein
MLKIKKKVRESEAFKEAIKEVSKPKTHRFSFDIQKKKFNKFKSKVVIDDRYKSMGEVINRLIDEYLEESN